MCLIKKEADDEIGKEFANAHLTVQGKNKNQAKRKGKGKIPAQAYIGKESKCFFFLQEKEAYEEGLH